MFAARVIFHTRNSCIRGKNHKNGNVYFSLDLMASFIHSYLTFNTMQYAMKIENKNTTFSYDLRTHVKVMSWRAACSLYLHEILCMLFVVQFFFYRRQNDDLYLGHTKRAKNMEYVFSQWTHDESNEKCKANMWAEKRFYFDKLSRGVRHRKQVFVYVLGTRI